MRLFSFSTWAFRTFTATAMTKFRPLVFSGPSGGGKSTLLTRLFKEFEGVFAFSVSHTTRKPRDGEMEGREYYFVERAEFEKMIAEKKFLEHAEFAGNRYGTSKMAVEKVQSEGKICVLDVEVKGVQNIKETDLNAKFFFVQPPDMEALKQRLQGRGSESKESLQRRLDTAKEAMDYAQQPGSYDHIIVNDDLEKAYQELRQLLIDDIRKLQSEKEKQA